MIEGEAIPVEFYSKKLTEAQQKYSTFDRELLGAYSAVLRFKEFLEGRHVILCTDHKPLVSAFYSKTPAKSDRQQRYLSALTEYVTSMVYIRGEDNVVADALSRHCASITLDPIDLPSIARLQENDEEIKEFTPRLQEFPLQEDSKIWCDCTTS